MRGSSIPIDRIGINRLRQDAVCGQPGFASRWWLIPFIRRSRTADQRGKGRSSGRWERENAFQNAEFRSGLPAAPSVTYVKPGAAAGSNCCEPQFREFVRIPLRQADTSAGSRLQRPGDPDCRECRAQQRFCSGTFPAAAAGESPEWWQMIRLAGYDWCSEISGSSPAG